MSEGKQGTAERPCELCRWCAGRQCVGTQKIYVRSFQSQPVSWGWQSDSRENNQSAE